MYARFLRPQAENMLMTIYRIQPNPYRCCKETTGKGCTTMTTHDFHLPPRAVKHKDFRETPAASVSQPKAHAVVLDCEMATCVGNASEAIFVCATDYVTGTVILNHYVYPREKIIQMNTFIHGVPESELHDAKAKGTALIGWKGARAELWKHIDANTIMIGHALQNDLGVLRMIHHRIVDSSILARSTIGMGPMWGLKTLCTELLKIPFRKRKRVHNCMEDVLATREVVLSCTHLHKEAFKSWADVKRIEQIRLVEEREKEREARAAEKAKKKVEEAAKKFEADAKGTRAGNNKKQNK